MAKVLLHAHARPKELQLLQLWQRTRRSGLGEEVSPSQPASAVFSRRGACCAYQVRCRWVDLGQAIYNNDHHHLSPGNASSISQLLQVLSYASKGVLQLFLVLLPKAHATSS